MYESAIQDDHLTAKPGEKSGNSKGGHGIKEKMGKISGRCGSFSSVHMGQTEVLGN